MIPTKLKRDEINFVLLERSGKKPFQKNWQNKIIKHNNSELINHLSSNGNYGVMGGGNKNLIIIDFDNEDLQKKLIDKLPETFTVRTGSGLLHLYYFSDKCDSFKIFDEEINTLTDVQGKGKQVVGANSIHPNGNKYEVFKDLEINYIDYSEIKALLMMYDKKPKKERKIFEKPLVNLSDDFIETLKSQIHIEQVLSSFGVNTSKNPTECPFHSSKGGKCLGFEKEVAHCFHCDGSWNIFSLVKEYKKCDFKEALEYLANLGGLNKELEQSRKKYYESLRSEERDEKETIKQKFLDLISGKIKKWGDATEVLVDYIKEKNYIYSTKNDLKSEMWIYKRGIYTPNGKSEIKEILRDILGSWYSTFIYNQVISKIEPDTYIDEETFFNSVNKNEVPVENGILNLTTKKLSDFEPNKIFFNKLPIKYDPIIKCPKIDKFLQDLFPCEEDKLVYYELGGFCLLKDYLFEKAFMFVGDGRNGKDKSLELIKRCIGIQNCCAVPLVSLDPNNFVISELFGKMANLAGDIGNQDLKDTSMFKALTGRSLISAKRKFLGDVRFVNYAKFVFACNELPMVYDMSMGFWDRWVLLEFPYTFVTKEELNKDLNNKNLKLRDEGIIEKITTEEELSGLLNEFLNGFDRLMMNKNFSLTRGTDEIKNLWIRKSNSFIAFCMDNIEEDYESKISKSVLRRKYAKYCKLHKIPTKSEYVVKRVLQEQYGASDERSFIIGDKSDYLWVGIKFKGENDQNTRTSAKNDPI